MTKQELEIYVAKYTELHQELLRAIAKTPREQDLHYKLCEEHNQLMEDVWSTCAESGYCLGDYWDELSHGCDCEVCTAREKEYEESRIINLAEERKAAEEILAVLNESKEYTV